jgi:trigger factor
MAEQQTDTAVAEQDAFQYPIQVEDAGPATKKVTVEIPEARIQEKLSEQFKDLRGQAALPGFRPGHAPAKLIERRFAKDVREQVRSSLIRESYEQAVEQNKLQVLGEPEFDDVDQLGKLPDTGSFRYSFSVEVRPEFTLPDLAGLTVKKPKINVTDDHVQQALKNLRDQQGTMQPVEDRGVEESDFLIADVHVKVDGEVIAHQHGAQLVARSGRIGGIQVPDLAEKLAGLKPGETREITVAVPADNTNPKLAGKDAVIEIKLADIKKLVPAELTPEFLEDLGFANQDELLAALREQMEERITSDIQQSMRQQVSSFLHDNVQMDLPTKLSDRQESRVLQRRATSLLMRGIPEQQIRENLEQIRQGAKDEGLRELKLNFILQKIAEDRSIDVDEDELNGQVAMIAIQQGQRPEKLKQEMNDDGRLLNLYVQLREQKALDALLAEVKVEEVDAAAASTTTEEKKD